MGEKTDDEFDVVFTLAFAKGIDDDCDCRIPGTTVDLAERLQDELLELFSEGFRGDGWVGTDS